MDEFIFRSSQKFENLQYQLGIAATQGKTAAIQLTDHTKQLVTNALSSSRSVQLQNHLRELWQYLITVADEAKYKILYYADPRKYLRHVVQVLGSQRTKRDIIFCCTGIVAGTAIGILIGISIHKQKIVRYMQAVQCVSYKKTEAVAVVEDAVAPQKCEAYDVIVSVKAGSLQLIDVDICKGYGRNIRNLLSKYYQYSKHDLPVTLGRDCTGVVTDIGPNVTSVDVGDDVWLTAPFWAPGTLSQIVLAHEDNVGKKPKNIGFEGASSLPYAGGLAIDALYTANLNDTNAQHRRIFVEGGCTPVGSVLIQLLSLWDAHVTTTCYKRAVPVATALGAHNVIVLSEEYEVPHLLAELQSKQRFDVIFNTRSCGISTKQLQAFVKQDDNVICTLPQELATNNLGTVSTVFYDLYIRVKCKVQSLLGMPINDFGETHICHISLDRLTEFVENGQLKTLVDKVYHPGDIETAMKHIQTKDSIGSTVITFR